ncbi:type II secretion system F family protein [Desulforamulus ruminis]|uniref:Type II secretion system F domain protein n=1 Tax=Desulforamulus ruminis (strain ATCC 23193 / DSM 2154 / NCIMB 8452 / DL) TaxID=696281 RepID=F6DTD1_DESRL|nr:type II secretion system F family protein [Desulforamulus ruminis]AEG58948.1 Type II secretion system F domain protein [Desulforamulus ruminis DSM 2154]
MVRINAFGSLIGLSVFFFFLAGLLWYQRSPVTEKLNQLGPAPVRKEPVLWQKILGVSLRGDIKEKELFSADLILSAFTAVCLYIFLLDMVTALLAGLGTFFIFPRMYARYRIRKLQLEFNRNLPRAVYSITSTLQGGSTLLQGFGNAHRELLYPVNQLFLQVVEDTEASVPLEQAVQNMADKVGTSAAYLLADSIALIKEIGGGEAAINLLESVAESVREEEYIAQKIRANTRYLLAAFAFCTAFPFGLAAFLSFTMPEYLQIMATLQGKILTALSGIILLTGWWIVYGIIKRTREML